MELLSVVAAVDLCDDGSCVHPPLDGLWCDDYAEHPCKDGVCQGGGCVPVPLTGPECPGYEEDPCNDGQCQEGACVPLPLTGPTCQDDGDVCTEDVCDNGVCSHPPATDCLPCTGGYCIDGSCDPEDCAIEFVDSNSAVACPGTVVQLPLRASCNPNCWNMSMAVQPPLPQAATVTVNPSAITCNGAWVDGTVAADVYPDAPSGVFDFSVAGLRPTGEAICSTAGTINVLAVPCDAALEDGYGCYGDTVRIRATIINTGSCLAEFAWTATQTGGPANATMSPAAGSELIAAGATHWFYVNVQLAVNSPSGEAQLLFSATAPGSVCTDTATVAFASTDEVSVEAEDSLTECMEGRYVTFTATVTGTVPPLFLPIEYTFHFEHADGTPWTDTVLSNQLQIEYDAVMDDVLDGDADHFFDTPIYVEAKLQGCDPKQSPTLSVRVYKLWIEHFRHNATGKDWKVVVGELIAYSAIASADCANWDWDMEDGVPDAWNPTGGDAKTGTGMSIPYSDLSGLFGKDGDDFGAAYGTVNVFCEDAEGNNHRIYSTDLDPPQTASVFFDPQVNVEGGAPSEAQPPLWYLYWQNAACPDLDEFEYRHMASYGESQVLFGIFWDTHVLRVGIPTGGTHYPTGLFVNGVQYGGATGIDCCAEVTFHEKHHNVLAIEIHGDAADTDPASAAAPFVGDWLPDVREPGLGCSTANKDTFNLQVLKSPVYVGYGDNEYSALVVAHARLGAVVKDWSKGGKQW